MNSLKLLIDMLIAVFTLLSIFWQIWVVLGCIVLIRLAFKLYKNNRLSQSGITELDKLDGEDFEKYLELLFRKLGYTVKRTPYQRDYGADLIIQRDEVQTAVQAKRHNRSVGVKAIQESVAAKEYYQCNQAMVVTNSYYSQQAKKLAQANHVELWDRDKLVKVLLSLKQSSSEIPEPLPNLNPDNMPATPGLNSTPSSSAQCVICGKAVSPQVRDYCLSHQEKFEGKIYCYEHQKLIKQPVTRKVTQ
ncbi:MAG: restriction endonuclease [Caldilineaceae bacterium]